VSGNALHNLCQRAETCTELWNARDLVSVQAAACADAHGRTPLHILSQNQSLSQILTFDDDDSCTDLILPASSFDSMANEKPLVQFVVLLLKAYPASMMTTDGQGNIPFEEAST
jgi:hypothetical protein